MRLAARPASSRRDGRGRRRIFRWRWLEAWPDGHVEEVEARTDGTLVWPPRGTNGFGYDPMFLPDGFDRTFGEMTSIEKHGLPPLGLGLSHRARAFVKLAEICLE
jgi:XTP/dITP diphosphohydrolase